MGDIADRLADLDSSDIAERIRAAGVAGAGGAGFPAYAKWDSLEAVDHLLVNHQESEPNYYADKWLGREYADDLAELFEALCDTHLQSVLVGTKVKYREEWLRELEDAIDGSFHGPEDLPVDADSLTGATIAATPDVYTYSEENVLLMVTAGVQIGEDLPTDHGWLVHNTESLYNVYSALLEETPVTRKYVHVDGDVPRHRCLEVPVGTTARELLRAAGLEDGALPEGTVMADGGPGWCYEIDESPEAFGVRKRTNAVLVLDEDLAAENEGPEGQIDVLTERDWTDRDHEREPAEFVPESVRIPLITNAAYTGLVEPSDPVVEVGDAVRTGELIARAVPDAISNPQHASIDGTVTDVTDTHVVIERE